MQTDGNPEYSSSPEKIIQEYNCSAICQTETSISIYCARRIHFTLTYHSEEGKYGDLDCIATSAAKLIFLEKSENRYLKLYTNKKEKLLSQKRNDYARSMEEVDFGTGNSSRVA